MSDPEKPTPDDLAPASVHRQRWEDAKTTEEALRRNLFAARDALKAAGQENVALRAGIALVIDQTDWCPLCGRHPSVVPHMDGCLMAAAGR